MIMALATTAIMLTSPTFEIEGTRFRVYDADIVISQSPGGSLIAGVPLVDDNVVVATGPDEPVIEWELAPGTYAFLVFGQTNGAAARPELNWEITINDPSRQDVVNAAVAAFFRLRAEISRIQSELDATVAAWSQARIDLMALRATTDELSEAARNLSPE